MEDDLTFLDKIGKIWNGFWNTPYSTTALDELGHPIRQANKTLATYTSTPKRDVAAAATGITLPLTLSSFGLVPTLTGLASTTALGSTADYIARNTAESFGVGKEGLDFVGDVASLAGGFGFKPGVKSGYIIQYPFLRYFNFKPKMNAVSRLEVGALSAQPVAERFGAMDNEVGTGHITVNGKPTKVQYYSPEIDNTLGMQAIAEENAVNPEIHFAHGIGPKGKLIAKTYVEGLPEGTVISANNKGIPIDDKIGTYDQLLEHLKHFKEWELPWRQWELTNTGHNGNVAPMSADAIKFGADMSKKGLVTQELHPNYFLVGVNNYGKGNSVLENLIAEVKNTNGKSLNKLNDYLYKELGYSKPATFENGEVRIPFTYFRITK